MKLPQFVIEKLKRKLERKIDLLGVKVNLLKSQAKYPQYFRDKVHVHPASKINRFTYIGRGTNINGPAFIGSSEDAPVYIGKYCAIAHNLRIRTRNHNYSYPNLQDRFQRKYNLPLLDAFKGKTIIGNNVWIGDNVLVLPGAKIGDGSIIGAGAVVTREEDQLCFR
ncbi:MAG: DapH/DapD/GlmU-related protein [Cyanobacteria bacterium J06636_16]